MRNESFIHFPLAEETFILVHLHFCHQSNLHFYSIINEQESHLHFPARLTSTLSGAFLMQRDRHLETCGSVCVHQRDVSVHRKRAVQLHDCFQAKKKRKRPSGIRCHN